MNRRLAVLAAFAAIAASLACVPKAARGPSHRTAHRVPPRDKSNTPKPSPAIVTEGPAQPVLARARWLFVSTGAKLDEVLPERLAKDAPAVVSNIIDAHDGEQITPKNLAELRRLAFGRKAPPDGRSVRVSAEELVEEGWDPPAQAIWIVGPEGPCRGVIGDGFVGTYDDRRFIEIAWEVAGCAPAEWAQVGIVAEAVPRGLRWVPAQALASAALDHGKPWNHALAEHARMPAVPDAKDPPRKDVVRLRAIPGTEPMAAQILTARQWWRDPMTDFDTGEEIGGTSCVYEELRAQVRGEWGKDGFTAYSAERFGASFPVLVGALVQGETAIALVWRVGVEGVVTVPVTDEFGAPGWVEARLRLGSWQPAAAATWEWDVGPHCPPSG